LKLSNVVSGQKSKKVIKQSRSSIKIGGRIYAPIGVKLLRVIIITFLVLTILSCCATFWLIVTFGGAVSGAPWRPWNVGGRHGWWVHGLLVFTYIHRAS
jgi:hypothetical protein